MTAEQEGNIQGFVDSVEGGVVMEQLIALCEGEEVLGMVADAWETYWGQHWITPEVDL